MPVTAIRLGRVMVACDGARLGGIMVTGWVESLLQAGERLRHGWGKQAERFT